MNSQNETSATPRKSLKAKRPAKETRSCRLGVRSQDRRRRNFQGIARTMIKLSAQGFVTKTLLNQQKGENNGDLESDRVASQLQDRLRPLY